jgi:hypothetical protein
VSDHKILNSPTPVSNNHITAKLHGILLTSSSLSAISTLAGGFTSELEQHETVATPQSNHAADEHSSSVSTPLITQPSCAESEHHQAELPIRTLTSASHDSESTIEQYTDEIFWSPRGHRQFTATPSCPEAPAERPLSDESFICVHGFQHHQTPETVSSPARHSVELCHLQDTFPDFSTNNADSAQNSSLVMAQYEAYFGYFPADGHSGQFPVVDSASNL